MSSRNACHQEFEAFRTRLNQAHTRLVSIHQRYVQLADLSDAKQHTLTCLRTIAVAMANRSERRRSWNLLKKIFDISIRHQRIGSEIQITVRIFVQDTLQDAPLNNTAPVQINYQEDQQHDPTLLPTHLVGNHDNQNIDTNSSNGQTNDRGSPTSNKPESDPAAAKKLRFDLEFKLRQKQLQKDREMKDLELKYAREQEDILLEIQHIQKISQLSFSPLSDQGPQFASTPVYQVNTTLPPTQGPVVYTGQPQLASSRNWPKLVVAKFDGDPRGWTKFVHGIKATLRDTNMPKSLKLLGLQDNRNSEASWAVLESKYGSPSLIIQAHNQHLQQLPPFKHSDFNGLFNMAVAVRDAVSSVNQEHIVMFTTVVTSLCAKLPIHSQSDWCKLAGIKPPAYQYNANRQSNSQSPGSSNYGGRNPTILNQSLLTATDIEFHHSYGGAPQPSIRPVLLAIVPVVIEANGLSCITSAVLDPGSEATLITRSLANLLHLQGPSLSVQFGSFSSSVLIESEKVCFKLKSIDGTHTTETTNTLVVLKINLSCRRINWPEIKHRWSHLAGLELPPIDSDQVELLIGMDLSTTHQTNQIIGPIEGKDGPAAHHTLVVGPSNKKNVNLQSACLLPSLSSVVDQFRSLETFGIMVGMLHRSITFVNSGFRIALPLRPNFTTIPNNRNQALSRFYSIEHRLIQPDMRDIAIKYRSAIEKLIASGTAVHVNSSDINEPAGSVWYLPNFFVVNHNKPDKIRVTVSFRALPDIEAFYHRIGVEKQDQSLQRFVFRPFGSSEPVQTFQFTTLILGAVCSSSAAVQTLQYAAKSNNAFPQVGAKMRDNFYSDNLVDSFETENETVDFAKAVTKTLEAGGFRLTAFASSSHKVLETIPQQDRSSQVLNINLSALPVEYQLGMKWELATDTYGIRVRSMPNVKTKRELLSAISLIFDPLGICLPWKTWATGLENTSFPCVNRCFRPVDFPLEASIFRLVIFADASSVAFGAVAYLRAACNRSASLSFVMAKGRIACLKPITVPRLELEAAVLAVRLSLLIRQELRIPIYAVEYYTDSQIVLHQLRSHKPNRPSFVCKRRDEILSHSELDHWYFVRSEDNPADDCTRAPPPKDFEPNCRWITVFSIGS
ncbi:hypothetical protein GHT06_005391 [Daphnia sinensis]|uniref:Uncharacterized protein n=1 Tax=Daphnia sinensis TaxID=1820382 RepID=A0AAD5PPF6_9CRUS|nr:hypothetical protein GHT06_005391 [Daphnia sinensis]